MICLAVVGLGGEAWADWIVVTVSDGGDTSIDQATRRVVRTRAEVRLRSAEYNTLSRDSAEQVDVTDEGIARCVEEGQACMKKALAAAEVDRLLHFELRARSPGYLVIARLYNGVNGALLRKEDKPCSECTDRESLGRAIEDVTAALLAARDDTSAPGPATWLEITTDPPGATVAIDAKTVGPSGRAYAVQAGTHTVRVDLDGYDSRQTSVEVKPEQVTKLALVLNKHIDAPPEPWRYGVLKWAGMGTGLGLTALGMTGIIIDGPRFDGSGARQPEEWDTLGAGIFYTAVGVCLMGFSGYMFYHDTTVQKEAAPPAPARGVTLQRVRQGWTVGLSGRF